jgi:hypothetical protein
MAANAGASSGPANHFLMLRKRLFHLWGANKQADGVKFSV